MQPTATTQHTVKQKCFFLNTDADDQYTMVRFDPSLWTCFDVDTVVDRLHAWNAVACGPWFRSPVTICDNQTASFTEPHPLPGFKPLSEIKELSLSEEERLLVCISICNALSVLHDGDFFIGFLDPERVFIHPKTLEVSLGVQPFPSCFPFVNALTDFYPYSWFSRQARAHNIPRVADFYGVGCTLYWLFTGESPVLPLDNVPLPPSLRDLCCRLLIKPHTFLFMQDVVQELKAELGVQTPLSDTDLAPSVALLHPMDPPLSDDNRNTFQGFLRERHPQLVTVISEDDTARTDVIRQHISEVIEHDFFITVTCRNLPFATLREMMDRVMFNAESHSAEASSKKLPLLWKLNEIMRRHYEGDDVVYQLSDWLLEFSQSTLPALQFQNVYIAFEACEEMDADSQRVLSYFWSHCHDQVPRVQIILTGRTLPTELPRHRLNNIEVGGAHPDMYSRLIQSQCGKMERCALQALTTWMCARSYHVSLIRVVLETLIADGILKLNALSGWYIPSGIRLDSLDVSPLSVLAERIERLNPSERSCLQTFAFLPAPIRARSLYRTSGLDTAALSRVLSQLQRLGLAHVYYEDSVFIPVEVTELVIQQMSEEEQQEAANRALHLQQKYRPGALPPLIKLAEVARDARRHYYFLIRYYRDVRAVLSSERKRDMLVSIRALQLELGRSQLRCWDRQLCEAFYRQNDVKAAATLAADVYARTGDPRDKFRWDLYRMFLGDIDLAKTQGELLEYTLNKSERLDNRLRAAIVLSRLDAYLPLQREKATSIHQFYQEDVYPNAQHLPTRLFVEFSIHYAIHLFQYFPEKEDYTGVLLEMLESVLSESDYRDMVSSLYDAYVFHSNISVCRKYTGRQLELARRTGAKLREQICHTNSMEFSLYQGDVKSYEFHKEQVVLVDEIRRRDLVEQFTLHQLNYAFEWDRFELFEQIGHRLLEQGITPNTDVLWQVYMRYAAFRRGLALPDRLQWQETNHFTLFIDALYEVELGNVQSALNCFQGSIAHNGYHLTAGWSFREMIRIMLQHRRPEARYWLNQFELYLKKYCYDVFWPDYYYLSAKFAKYNDDFQRSVLFLRRAVNAYQLIEKDHWRTEVECELAAALQPTYIPEGHNLRSDEMFRRLLRERETFLQQSLDLQIIIQMSEQVTESLDLIQTCEHLAGALFEYFPVTHAVMTFDLYHRSETRTYSSSGPLSEDPVSAARFLHQHEKLSFDLYRQGKQFMTVDVYVQGAWESTSRRHMLHFLSVIKPHIANAIHYMEMMTDNLTGFYQRRYFTQKLEQEFQVAKQYGLDLSLVMLDIDNFRRVNEFGHPEGDKVLKELSQVVQSVIRKMDIPGRYGGEELLLILPKTDAKIALQLAHRLRDQIEEAFQYNRPYRVTVSVGVASMITCQAQTPEELVSYADSAEIHAKSTGKNRVVAAWTLPVRP